MAPSPALYAHGLVFSESVLHSEWFAVLAAFVAINTVMYCVLTIAKMLPKVYVADWVTSANRRAESRSIHPGGVPPELG
jgi:hypothetical protein